MLRVALTGGMACGKSAVAEMFAQEGAHVIQADKVAHQFMQPGQAVYEQVVKHFGRDIVQADGAIDRSLLAAKAFSDPGRIAELNQLVHPAVIAEQERWMAEQEQYDPNGIAMVEAALILEARVGRRFDKIVVVTCKPEQRLERFAERAKVPPAQARAEVERRMKAQMPEAEKIKAADFVIDNSGSLARTQEQVQHIYQQLVEAGGKSGTPIRV
jgi:dephospho-CoA kinase